MRSIARGLLHTAAFLELSGDEVIDADAAVRALEDIASCLGEASADERAAIVEASTQLALEAEAGGNHAASEFFRSFPASLGW